MNENDRNLIVDLIDGHLSPEQETAALALIIANPQLRAEYETQRVTAARLATEASPFLTPIESARLRAELKKQLHLDDPVPVAAAPSPRWSRWLAPLGGFAVAAAVIVGAFVVLPGTLSGDDASGSLEVAALATTVAPNIQSAEAPSSSAADAAKESSQGDVSSAESESLSQADDAEGAPVGGQAFDEAGAAPLVDIPSVDGVDLEELAKAYRSDPGGLGESLLGRSIGASPEMTDQAYSCVAVASENAGGADALPVAITTHDGLDAVIVAIVPSNGDPYLAAYDLGSCTEFATTLR